MTISLIFDIVLLLLLILAVIHGVHRGFILSLCGLLALFVAFAGATVAANHLAPLAVEQLTPRIETTITDKINESLGVSIPSSTPVPAEEALNALRDNALYQWIADGVEQQLSFSAQETIHAIAAAVAEAVVTAFVYPLLFAAAFLLILLLWNLFSRILNLASHLPVIHTLNGFLGGVAGFASGIVFLAALYLVLSRFSFFPNEDVIANTYLLQFFCTLPEAILPG